MIYGYLMILIQYGGVFDISDCTQLVHKFKHFADDCLPFLWCLRVIVLTPPLVMQSFMVDDSEVVIGPVLMQAEIY